MSTAAPSTTVVDRLSLRTVLLLDAVTCGVNGLAYVAGASLLSRALGPRPTILVALGIVLLVFAAAITAVRMRRPLSTGAVRGIAFGNLIWVAASVVALFVLDLTVVGIVWCAAQAAVVASFGVLQLRAVR